MVTRIEGKNGDFLLLADRPDELPWLVEVAEKSREYLMSAPVECLPVWAREWRERQS